MWCFSLFEHVVVSEPFRSTVRQDAATAMFVKSLFASKAFKMQWDCTPAPSTSVCGVSLFYMDKALHAAGSWKGDSHNGGKLKFFALEQNSSAGAKEPHNAATVKATVDFPATVKCIFQLDAILFCVTAFEQVPYFSVCAPADPLSASVLTVCNDGIIRNLALHKILSHGSKSSIPVDGAQQQFEDAGASQSPDIVDFQAGVGSGVHVAASATFKGNDRLAIALSNQTCKFVKIPEISDANSSGTQQFVHGWSDDSAISFIHAAAARKMYTVAFISNHPQPNTVRAAALVFFFFAYLQTSCPAFIRQRLGVCRRR
jgi:hypothetical protein